MLVSVEGDNSSYPLPTTKVESPDQTSVTTPKIRHRFESSFVKTRLFLSPRHRTE